ncbi:unnamed protein product [Oncorhynchus mykiss]|uniref:CACN subunit beta associated regulatory protein b n=1 Tax=Oncorhynchus mykiss TaxID=8022 RepID=A0A060XBC9_ONCMY|nr:unnamed protein product [Oncorhynchus mykiss]
MSEGRHSSYARSERDISNVSKAWQHLSFLSSPLLSSVYRPQGSLSLTWTMSNDSPVLTSLTENSTEVPVSVGRVENYVILLVLLCVFAGGSLILLSVLLLFCHRCSVGSRRYSRASDDPEKTNTTYVEDSQPTQGKEDVHSTSKLTPSPYIFSLLLSHITIRLDESDALSPSSCHDEETDRFMSTCSTGRRVSFNESALYEKESKTQDKGRRYRTIYHFLPLLLLRYTLTEGDFHHLKKARLTHLPLAPPPSTLKILTIMECESTESSSLNVNEPRTPKPPLYPLYQSSERAGPAWLGQSSGSALPGDIHHYILLDSRLSDSPPILCPPTPRSRTVSIIHYFMHTPLQTLMRGTSPAPVHRGSVLHFFCKLRRHASLEGAGPYFRKWKFDSSHRAASLDTKGSPKRRPFQRQRAASDNTDPTEEDSPPSPPLRRDIIQPLPSAHSQSSGLQHLSAGSLSPPTCPPSPWVRIKADSGSGLEGVLSAGAGPGLWEDPGPRSRSGSGVCISRQESSETQPSLYRDIWSLRASLEQYASSDQSSTDRESIRSDADSVCSLGGAAARSGFAACLSQDLGDELEEEWDRKLLQMDSGYTSIEAPIRAPEELRLGPQVSPLKSLQLQQPPQPQPIPSPRPVRLRRRDYSIDEKTDALFNEFLRHDPRFDQQESPLRSRHRSRIHLRKQWQRHKQYSDPGSGAGGRYSPSLERQSFRPLRRGDSAGYPLDTRYHSTLSPQPTRRPVRGRLAREQPMRVRPVRVRCMRTQTLRSQPIRAQGMRL